MKMVMVKPVAVVMVFSTMEAAMIMVEAEMGVLAANLMAVALLKLLMLLMAVALLMYDVDGGTGDN